MRVILPSDFKGEKYGFRYRLVNEGDADFITKIRTNPKVNNYLHQTSPDVEAQKVWIRQYKGREREGLDYYFIYFKDDTPLGVNRLYNIKEDGTFTTGSLVFDDNVPHESIVAAAIIVKEIAFEILGLNFSDCSDGVHKDNKKVIKLCKMFGTVFTGERQTELGTFLTGGTTKENFYTCANKIKKLMDLK